MYQTKHQYIYLSSNCHLDSEYVWSESSLCTTKKAPIHTGLVQLLTDTLKKNYLVDLAYSLSSLSQISTIRRSRDAQFTKFGDPVTGLSFLKPRS